MNNQNIPSNMISNEFRNQIVNELILPSYKNNIEYIIKTRTCWSIVSSICLTSSTILVGISSLLSFSSSNFPANNLNYYAGAVGVIAIIVKEFAAYANSQDHLKTIEANDVLKNIGIDFTFPDVTANKLALLQDNNPHNPLTSSATNSPTNMETISVSNPTTNSPTNGSENV